MTVHSPSNIGKSFGDSYLTNAELKALAIKLPEAHVLDSTGHESPGISRQEAGVFDLERQAVQDQLLAENFLSCEVKKDQRKLELWSDADQEAMLRVISHCDRRDDRELGDRHVA